MTAPLSLVPLALLWLGCASAQGVLDELFQVEVDLLLPPQSLLEGLSLRHKLEKVQVKINLAYWDSLRPRVAAFNRGKWPMLGVRVSEELANCSEMDFNFGSEPSNPSKVFFACSLADVVAVSESEFQMPHRLSSSEQGFDFEVMMVLHVFLREVSGVQKLAAGAQFSRIDSRRFYSLRKSRNLQKLRLAPVPVGDRAVAKAISQKFQGLHRRAFLEFELQPFESGCEVLVLDRVSRNFYVDAEEIAEDFFFDERQVSDEGAQSGAAPTRFAEYFENQRMDIEKLNRLGKSTSFGFRFEPRELRKAPARRVRFSHNLHLRYSESLDGQGETEYFFDAFSPRVAVVCEGSLRAQNDASFQENLRASFGRPPDTCDSTFPGNRQFIKDGQKSPGKPLLDIDLLFALERARKLGARAAKVLSPENIAAFFGEMGSLNRERQFSLSIALYQNLNKFAPVEPVTLKRAEVHFNFRTDESKNVFLRIPAGNRDLNPLVLCSTLGGLGLGVAVILVAVFKKFKQ